MAIGNKGTMLTRLLGLQQFNQRVNKKFVLPCPIRLEGFMKQTRACETSFKQPQNEVKMSLKQTPRSKRNRT